MAVKIGNILKANLNSMVPRLKSVASDNIQGAMSIGLGLDALSASVINEVAPGRRTTNYNSPYPLGDEWKPDPAYMVSIAFTDPNTQAPATVSGYMPDTISMGLGAEFSSPLESVGEALSSGPLGMTARMFGYKVSANVFSMLLWSGSSHIDMTLELRFVALVDTYEDVIRPIRQLYSLVVPSIESFSVTNSPVQLGMVKSPGPVLEIVNNDGSLSDNVNETANLAANAVGKVSGTVVANASDLVNDKTTVGQAVVNVGGAAMEATGSAINQALKDLRVKNNISIYLGEFAYMRSVVIKDVSPAYNVKADEDGNWTDATVSIQISTFVSPTNIDVPDLVGCRSKPSDGPTKDGTEVSTDLASLAGSGIAGAVTKIKVPALSKLEDVAKGAGLNVKFPTDLDAAVKKLMIEPQTPVTQIKGELYDNISSIGKDTGLASKVISGDKVGFSLGMTDAEATTFNRDLLSV